MLMNDEWIIENGSDIIDPFVEKQKSGGKISYGVSSFGYDIRLSNEFAKPTTVQVNDSHFGPVKAIDPKGFFLKEEIKTDRPFPIPPNSFILAKSFERVKVPEDKLILCLNKSTYARTGLIVNTTPLEPSWEGYITLELSNTTGQTIIVYPNEGIAQLLFIDGNSPLFNYSNKHEGSAGKYQNQVGITPSKVI